MGMLTIQTTGSFGNSIKQFSAMKKGHAHCVREAINHLSSILREAINNDHKCHDGGDKPSDGFEAKPEQGGKS